MGVRYNGVWYRETGGSPAMLVDENGNEAPPEAQEKHALKAMARAGMKPAGPPRKTTTKGDDRLLLCAQGHTPEQIAKDEGVDIEAVLRSMRPSRTRKRGQ